MCCFGGIFFRGIDISFRMKKCIVDDYLFLVEFKLEIARLFVDSPSPLLVQLIIWIRTTLIITSSVFLSSSVSSSLDAKFFAFKSSLYEACPISSTIAKQHVFPHVRSS